MNYIIDRHEQPDFEAIYELRYDEFDDPITPRMGYRLWYAAQCMTDHWRAFDDAELLAAALPAVARPYAVDESWFRRFANCFEHVESWLAGCQLPAATRCTGEQVAFYLVVDLAEDLMREGAIPETELLHLPDHGADDIDFDTVRDLPEDSDVLLLFSPRLDGVDEQIPLLHPSRWFIPFNPDEDDWSWAWTC